MAIEGLTQSQLRRAAKNPRRSETERQRARDLLKTRETSEKFSTYEQIELAPKTTFHPTPEQRAAVDMFASGEDAVLTAYAGAGKTSTLELIARSTARKGVYLAFNAVTAAEAANRFPQNVTCLTTHSFALKGIKELYASAKLFGSVKPRGLKQLHRLNSEMVAGKQIDGIGQAFLTLKTVQAFCQSADTEIVLSHVPHDRGQLRRYEEVDRNKVRAWVLERARALWGRMIDSSDETPLGHDGYLKVWSLGRPKLNYDFILLDEAQDTNPCVMDVLTRQACQVVYVGDPYQQIYEWRGAVNAMAAMETSSSVRLPRTFRFGEELATIATDILHNLGEATNLTSLPGRRTIISGDGAADVWIARKNETLITMAMKFQDEGRRIGFVGVKDDLLSLIGSVYDLKDGRPARHPDLMGFQNWDDVIDHAQLDEGEDLKVFVGLVQKFGVGRLYSTLKQAGNDSDPCDILLTSGHRSKGREWTSVGVCSDFDSGIDSKGRIRESEGRLFYVAITRAKNRLVIDPALLLRFRKAGRYIPDAELDALHEIEAEELAQVEAVDWRTSPEPNRTFS